jgi:hypothetical protein
MQLLIVVLALILIVQGSHIDSQRYVDKASVEFQRLRDGTMQLQVPGNFSGVVLGEMRVLVEIADFGFSQNCTLTDVTANNIACSLCNVPESLTSKPTVTVNVYRNNAQIQARCLVEWLQNNVTHLELSTNQASATVETPNRVVLSSPATAPNPDGAYNGAGRFGNKATHGILGFGGMRLADFRSASFKFQKQVNVGQQIYHNLQIFVGGTFYRIWATDPSDAPQPIDNGVNERFVDLQTEGKLFPGFFTSTLQQVLDANPDATIETAFTGNNGLPKDAVTSAIMIGSGDSNNLALINITVTDTVVGYLKRQSVGVVKTVPYIDMGQSVGPFNQGTDTLVTLTGKLLTTVNAVWLRISGTETHQCIGVNNINPTTISCTLTAPLNFTGDGVLEARVKTTDGCDSDFHVIQNTTCVVPSALYTNVLQTYTGDHRLVDDEIVFIKCWSLGVSKPNGCPSDYNRIVDVTQPEVSLVWTNTQDGSNQTTTQFTYNVPLATYVEMDIEFDMTTDLELAHVRCLQGAEWVLLDSICPSDDNMFDPMARTLTFTLCPAANGKQLSVYTVPDEEDLEEPAQYVAMYVLVAVTIGLTVVRCLVRVQGQVQSTRVGKRLRKKHE